MKLHINQLLNQEQNRLRHKKYLKRNCIKYSQRSHRAKLEHAKDYDKNVNKFASRIIETQHKTIT